MANSVYKNHSDWVGGRKGHIKMENGVKLDFSAPPALHGYPDTLTPEDAFMAAVNTCYFMMFVWAAERFKINLVSFECEAIGKVVEFIDKTSIFKEIILKLKIVAKETTIECGNLDTPVCQKIAGSNRGKGRKAPELFWHGKI